MSPKKHKYPAFVPPKVQACADWVLAGDSDSAGGWLAMCESVQSKLATNAKALSNATSKGEHEKLGSLRQDNVELTAQLRGLSNDIECLNRLTARGDMEEVYVLLAKELNDEDKTWLFINSALSARFDIEPYREAIRSAKQIKQAIAKTADKLAGLLVQFDRTGVQAPDEFHSLRALIRKADSASISCESVGHSEQPKLEDTGDEDTLEELEGEIDIVEIGEYEPPPHDHAQSMGASWGFTPTPVELILALAKEATEYEPREHHLIGAVLRKREAGAKSAFIRSFAHLLIENELALTPPLMRAMAMAATIVLDAPDVVVNYDDVRKALT